MNSHQKHQENVQEQESLAQKIQRQIYFYTVRKLAAESHYADVCRYRDQQEKHDFFFYEASKRIIEIQDEIDLCRRQIKAYKENDNKAKLIPDRLLWSHQ